MQTNLDLPHIMQSLKLNIKEKDINKFGWLISPDNKTTPLSLTTPEASEVCKELTKCGCKKKGNICKCMVARLVCTELCACCDLCTDI